jgi:hypothetical protein
VISCSLFVAFLLIFLNFFLTRLCRSSLSIRNRSYAVGRYSMSQEIGPAPRLRCRVCSLVEPKNALKGELRRCVIRDTLDLEASSESDESHTGEESAKNWQGCVGWTCAAHGSECSHCGAWACNWVQSLAMIAKSWCARNVAQTGWLATLATTWNVRIATQMWARGKSAL